jgi:hypothetical protein
MKNTTGLPEGLCQLTEAIGDVLEAQRELSAQMICLLTGGFGDLFKGVLEQTGNQKRKSCCDIPEPCWMPKCLGEFKCRLCPGASGTLRLFVTNEDIVKRTFFAVASGSAASEVTFAPGSLTLGAKERGTITATFTLPGSVNEGVRREAIVWLRGCRDYYLRWVVTAGDATRPCCDEIAICDGPDHILHWYDHFYCPRHCLGGGRTP